MSMGFNKEEFKKSVLYNVKNLFRRTMDEATPAQVFQAVSYAVKDVIIDEWIASQKTYAKEDAKTVYYLSMEFLMGRALGNNIINIMAQVEIREVLDELGFTNVHVVEEQALPDGDFPTVSYPNPEDKNAFSLAVKPAKEVDADLVLATDPDADRLGVYAKDSHTGEYRSFTGNMSGMLILEYILSQRKALGTLPENGAVVTTIVSGKMAREITKAYHVDLIETLTGFKYI